MNVVELFAGAAGLAQGFERSGQYETIALYDTFEAARCSYIAYRPHAAYYNRDVRGLEAEEVRQTLGERTLHGVLGGPPCQGFSLAGKRLTDSDINQLVIAYAHVVMDLLPPFLVMENVPQLMFHPLFSPLLEKFQESYYVTWGILNAARYGTPQTRHRLILIAYLKSYGVQPTLPDPTHGQLGQSLYAYHLKKTDDRVELTTDSADVIFGADPVIRKEVVRQASKVSVAITGDLFPLITVGDAISDLIRSIAGEGECADYTTPPQTEYQRHLRGELTLVANCVARKHKGEPLKIVQKLREGGTPSVGKSRGKDYYSQAYSRLHHMGLARTLTTYFQNAGSGRFYHYGQPRTLSIREGARLQGFPDDFVFLGNLAEQMQLVGNAVPLPLAEAVGRHISREFGQALAT